MQEVHAVIVDDEEKNIQLLEHFIKSYCPKVSVVGSALTKEDAVSIINEKKPQLIFLDVILDHGTGFDVLEAIEYTKYKVVFVSSYSQYAVKAFKYSAIDFILKPIEIEELVTAVEKAYEHIENEFFTTPSQIDNLSNSFQGQKPLDFIAVASMNKIDFVKTEEIVYLKSDGRYTVFQLVGGRNIVASKNMGEYEDIIDKNEFFRIHNSYMVNLKHIVKVNKVDGLYCEMSNNIALPIAKRRQDAFNRFLRLK